MPSELTKSVRAALSAFVASRSADGDDVPADILRVVRDEASNLLERQMVWDTFDADPYKLCENDEDVRRQIRRAQSLMNVISCSRCSTKEGYSSINAVVELSKDTKMRNVKDSLRLTFLYERNPIIYEAAQSTGKVSNEPEKVNGHISAGPTEGTDMFVEMTEHKGTHVTYTIDLSRDHCKRNRLVTVEVMASGESPSAEEAIPVEDDEDDVWEECDDEGNNDEGSAEDASAEGMDVEVIAAGEKQPVTNDSSDTCDKNHQISQNAIKPDGKDRYSAFIDPDVLMEFLKWTRLEFDDSTSIFFLMTFPFFEHEWDLLGYLLDAVYGGDGDEMSDEECEESTGPVAGK